MEVALLLVGGERGIGSVERKWKRQVRYIGQNINRLVSQLKGN
jgi:hypothetical protein